MKQISMRDAFFDRLYELAKQDRNIMVISADMGAPSLDRFRRDLSIQYLNVGIAEQNMITVATGLALSGKKVFAYAIMPFATLRCYEITRVDLCMMNLPITIVGVGAGFSYDDSGPTHHATEDISAMRALPNMTILNASDSVMAAAFATMACEIPGPSYVRLDREVLPVTYQPGTDFSAGLIQLKAGKDIAIIATGNMVPKAHEIASRLAGHSVEAGVIDLFRLKPINKELLLEYICQSERVLTLEEHFLDGGMGSAVAEVMVDHGKTQPLKRFGIRDKYYYTYGGRANIQSACGLDVNTVTRAILEWVKAGE
jgi:transketolase